MYATITDGMRFIMNYEGNLGVSVVAAFVDFAADVYDSDLVAIDNIDAPAQQCQTIRKNSRVSMQLRKSSVGLSTIVVDDRPSP